MIKWSLLYCVDPNVTEKAYKQVIDDIQFFIIRHTDRASFVGKPEHWGMTLMTNRNNEQNNAYITTMSYETDKNTMNEVIEYLKKREDIISYSVVIEE